MTEPISYHPGIFDVFKDNPDIDRWNEDHFPEIMWGLGYDLDTNNGYVNYVAHNHLSVKEPKNKRERKRNDLYYLEHAPRQIVGNFLFSYWRFLTHWAQLHDNEHEFDFLCRVIVILEGKY